MGKIAEAHRLQPITMVKEAKLCKVFERDLIRHSGIEVHNALTLPCFQEHTC